MRSLLNLFCFFSFLILVLLSCTKDKKPVVGATNRVDIKTLTIRNIGPDSAISGGEILSDGGDPISERGVCWSTSTNPVISQNRTINGSGTGTYTSIIKNLTPNTIYYVRAYIVNAQGTIYGDQVSFRSAPGNPKLETNPATSITSSSLITGGRNITDGGASISQKGICFSPTNPMPTISNSVIPSGSGTANFSVTISNLNPNTTYYIRAYATNSGGTGYGNPIQARTLTVQLPTITTTSVSSITHTTANSGGNIISDGGASVTQRGICWSTSPNPTISNSRTMNGSGIGSFSAQMNGLQPNTTYYVTAYAINSVGPKYGNEILFSTQNYSLRGLGPAGGRVFYDKGSYSNGWRYIEAAPSDQSSGMIWGCFGTNISGATSTGIGAGMTNTSAIVSGCASTSIAARICNNLVLNGYSDWYLPSFSEAQLMYSNLAAFSIGGFTSTYYWTSTQVSSTNAYGQFFGSATIASISKNSSYRVRAIRYF